MQLLKDLKATVGVSHNVTTVAVDRMVPRNKQCSIIPPVPFGAVSDGVSNVLGCVPVTALHPINAV